MFSVSSHRSSHVRANSARLPYVRACVRTSVQVFALAVLDNAVNLGAITFAVHISAGSGEEPVMRRSKHGVTSGASNMTASVPDKMGLTGARSAAAGSSHSHIR